MLQYFQDLVDSFSPYGPPSRQITYIYAPMISEFGKAMKSKSFHVRYTWFNNQTIKRKFYCYSLFYCALKTCFHKMFYFQFYFLLFFLLCLVFHLSTSCFILVFTHETGELGPFTFMLLDRGFFWIVCYWLVRHLHKGKVCLREKYQSSLTIDVLRKDRASWGQMRASTLDITLLAIHFLNKYFILC